MRGVFRRVDFRRDPFHRRAFYRVLFVQTHDFLALYDLGFSTPLNNCCHF